MWGDIVCANRDDLLAVLHAYTDKLTEMTQALTAGDRSRLVAVFESAKTQRDTFARDWQKPNPDD